MLVGPRAKPYSKGATEELMARLGHASPQPAMVNQHAASDHRLTEDTD